MKLVSKIKSVNIANLFILSGLFLIFIAFFPLIKDEAWFYLKEIKHQRYFVANNDNVGVEDSVFSRFLSSKPVLLDPVNRDFSIVIERIGVNAPIVRDVSVTNEEAYMEALKSGVAHALVSDYPTESASNVYLFAHASLNFFKLGKYATVFNLLKKLDFGDYIYVYYEGDEYVYTVVNTEVVKGWDISPITRSTIEPLLTLQTCDPPGTTLNRYVVTAKLKEVR